MNMRTVNTKAINAANPAYHKLNSVKDQLVADCARYLIDELEDTLGIRVTYSAENNVTLKFSDSRLGSVSVSSVPANPTYLCRWNLYTGECVEVAGKYKSHWIAMEEAHFFVDRIKGYLRTILDNEPAAPQCPNSRYNSEAPSTLDVPLDSYPNLTPAQLDKHQDDPDYLDYLNGSYD